MAKKISIDLEAGTANFIAGMDRSAHALDNVGEHASGAKEMLSHFMEGLEIGTGIGAAQKGFELIGEGFKTLAEGAELAIEKVSEWTREAMESAQRTTQLATALGFSVETIQAVTNEAKHLGIDGAAVSNELSHMSEKINELATNGGHAADILAKYGVNVRELAALSPDDQLRRVADAMRDVSTGEERATLTTEFLGKAGKAMAGAFAEGSSAIDRWVESGKEAGTVLSTLDLGRLEGAKQASDELGERWEGIKNQIALALTPAIQDVAEIISSMAPNAEKFGATLKTGLKEGVIWTAAFSEQVVHLDGHLREAAGEMLKLSTLGAIGSGMIDQGQAEQAADLLGPVIHLMKEAEVQSEITAKQFAQHMEEMRHAATAGVANTDAEKFTKVLKEMDDQLAAQVLHLDKYQIAVQGLHMTMQQAAQFDSKHKELADAEATQEGYKKAEEAAKKQEERLQHELENYRRFTEDPALRAYQDKLKEMNDLAANGKLTQEQYAQGAAKAQFELEKTKDKHHEDRDKSVEAVTRRFSFDMQPQQATDPKTALIKQQTDFMSQWNEWLHNMWDKIYNGNGGASSDQSVNLP